MLLPGFSFTSTPSAAETSPEQILEDLQKQIQTDFPAVPSTSYEVKYVHPDLEEHLSPAFYLTPPIDTLSPNDIYINRHANMSGLELYTTLAHEGFPGHLYQTITFASSAPDPVRYLPAMGGYVEGWATYAESFAYTYYQPDSTDGQLAWLNRSLNLCMMSLLDTVIHYNGWNQERCCHLPVAAGDYRQHHSERDLPGDRGRSRQLPEILPWLSAVS